MKRLKMISGIKIRFVNILLIMQFFFIGNVYFSCSRNDTRIHFVRNILITPKGNLIVGTTRGIFCSHANNNHWEQIKQLNTTSLLTDSYENIYAGSTDGLFRSIDNGQSWEKLNFPSNVYDAHGIILAKNSNGFLFAGTSVGLFCSKDKGNTWIKTNFPKNVGIKSLAVNSEDNIWAGTWEQNIFRSLNDGNNWTAIGGELLKNAWINSIVVSPNGYIFVGTHENYIFCSTDNGNNWLQLDRGLEDGNVEAIGVGSNGRIFVSNNLTIFYSDDDGKNWQKTNSELIEIFNCFAFDSKTHIYAGTMYGGLFISKDNGLSWFEIKNYSE